MYKALITDIDGTVGAVGTNGSDISDEAVAAVKQAIAKGVKIACATGRRWQTAEAVVKKLGLVEPCIIEGGSCIIDPTTGNVLWQVEMTKSASEKALDVIKRLATDKVDDKSTAGKSDLPFIQTKSPTGENRIIYLLGVSAEVAEQVIAEVNKLGVAVAHSTTPSWYGGGMTDVHVTNPEGTKEHAIAKWQEMVGVKQAETIGLGDSGNDVPLFESVGLKVAVGDAREPLLSKADHVVSDHDKGALKEVIDKWLLPSLL